MRLLLALLLTLSLFASTSASADAPAKQSEPSRQHGRVAIVEREITQRGAAFEARMVVRLVQSRRSAMNACYERALASGTAPFAGRITIELSIHASGDVRVDVVADTTGNASVAACVRRVVQGFRFTPGPDGDASFTLPFDLSLVP